MHTLFKLVAQGGLSKKAQSGQEGSSSKIRQGKYIQKQDFNNVNLNARSTIQSKTNTKRLDCGDPHIIGITESMSYHTSI